MKGLSVLFKDTNKTFDGHTWAAAQIRPWTKKSLSLNFCCHILNNASDAAKTALVPTLHMI